MAVAGAHPRVVAEPDRRQPGQRRPLGGHGGRGSVGGIRVGHRGQLRGPTRGQVLGDARGAWGRRDGGFGTGTDTAPGERLQQEQGETGDVAGRAEISLGGVHRPAVWPGAGAHRVRGDGGVLENACGAGVTQLHGERAGVTRWRGAQQDGGGLDAAVRDAVLVQVGQGGGQVRSDLGGQLSSQGTGRDAPGQRCSLYPFQHQNRCSVVPGRSVPASHTVTSRGGSVRPGAAAPVGPAGPPGVPAAWSKTFTVTGRTRSSSQP